MPTPSTAPTYVPPTTATAGETLCWLVRGTDTPASDGWALAVACTPVAGSVVTVAGTQEAGGPDFRVTITAAQTTALGAGNIGWSALASKAGEVVTLDRGRILLVAASGLTTDETRLADIDVALHALALGAVQSYSIAGHVFTRYTLAELRAYRNTIASRVQRARTGSAPQHLARFVRAS